MAFDFKNFGVPASEATTQTPTKTGGFDFESFGTSTVPQVKQNTLQSTLSDIQAPRVQRIQESATSFGAGEQGLARTAFQIGGELVGGALTDPIEAIVSRFTPEKAKVVGSLLVSPIGKTIRAAADKIGSVKSIQDFAMSPESQKLERDINAGLEYLNLLPVPKGTKAITKVATVGADEATNIVRDIASLADDALTPSESAIKSSILESYNSSVKPTTQKTVPSKIKYNDSVLNAINTIAENKQNLTFTDVNGGIKAQGVAPSSIEDLSQAIWQTKKNVYEQYSALSKQATEGNFAVNVKPVANEIMKVADDAALQITNPEVVDYALAVSKRLNSVNNGSGILTPDIVERVVKNYNDSLSAFYRNPSYDSASKVAVDAAVANGLRKELDALIENATGAEYQSLKNQYGALKSIEKDVVRAANRVGNKNVKGLLDYTDILTSGQIVGGILSLNPQMFASGVVERGIKEYFKFLNDPNRAIKSIFESIESVKAGKKSFTPKSKTGKIIQEAKSNSNPQSGSINLGAKVGAEDTLIQKAKKYKSAEEFVKLPSIKIDQINKLNQLLNINPKLEVYAKEGGKNFVNRNIKSIKADYVEVPTASKKSDNGMRTVKEVIFEFEDGTTDKFKNPVFSISYNSKQELTDIWKKANNKTAK